MIAIHKQNSNIRIKDKRVIIAILRQIISDHSKVEANINIILTNDEKLLNLNRDYLKHNYLTDILTFSYNEDESIEADLFISEERAKDNASKFNVTFENELKRLMIHGILHCCGQKDKTVAEKKEMRRKEEFYLNKQT